MAAPRFVRSCLSLVKHLLKLTSTAEELIEKGISQNHSPYCTGKIGGSRFCDPYSTSMTLRTLAEFVWLAVKDGIAGKSNGASVFLSTKHGKEVVNSGLNR